MNEYSVSEAFPPICNTFLSYLFCQGGEQYASLRILHLLPFSHYAENHTLFNALTCLCNQNSVTVIRQKIGFPRDICAFIYDVFYKLTNSF